MQGPSESGDSEPIAEMNVIPFIDICLVLLIIVLVTATFSTQLLGFDHPLADKTEYVEASNVVTVDIAADGKCSIGGKQVELAGLRAEIEAQGGGGKGGLPDVVLRAPPKTPSHFIVSAADQIKTGGKVRLAFAVSE